MLYNFVSTPDLYVLDPMLRNRLPANQSDFQPQIDAGFDRMLNDLYSQGHDARYISPYLQLTSETLTTSVPATGSVVEAFGNVKRFVVEVFQHSGVITAALQGSWNKTDWTELTTLDIGASDSSGLFHVPFAQQFKYYRHVVTPASGSIVANVFLSERAFDSAIMAHALTLVYRSQIVQDGDTWSVAMVSMEKEYQLALATVKFLLDANKNQQADSEDVVVSKAQIRFLI